MTTPDTPATGSGEAERRKALPRHLKGLAILFRAWPNEAMWGRSDQAEHAAGLVEQAAAALSTPPASSETVERTRIVAWLRNQSDKGADIGLEAEKGSTRRAAFGGGSYALKRAADEIENGGYLDKTAALRTPSDDAGERMREALCWFVDHGSSIYADVCSGHQARSSVASEWMREDDRDFRTALQAALDTARAALTPSEQTKGEG